MRLEEQLQSMRTDFETLVQVAHLFHEGQAAYDRGEYSRAVAFFQDALALQPNNARILTRLGRCYTNLGNLPRAEHFLRLALEQDGDDMDVLRALAIARRFTDPDEALEFARTAAYTDSSDCENWNYLGLLLRDRGHYREALASHCEAEEVAPGDPLTLFYIATLHWALGEDGEAIARVVEARSNVERLERTRRIRPLWAAVVRWAAAYLADPVEESAILLAEQLAELSIYERNRAAVIRHMLFVLGAGAPERAVDHPCLRAFPDDEVAAIVGEHLPRAPRSDVSQAVQDVVL